MATFRELCRQLWTVRLTVIIFLAPVTYLPLLIAYPSRVSVLGVMCTDVYWFGS